MGGVGRIGDESITIYPRRTRTFSIFEGTGLVKRISRGENFDVVYAVFGVHMGKQRAVVVIENRARRQILTLKCGQYAYFYGACIKRKIRGTYTNSQGKQSTVDTYRWELYAYVLQGYFVPKMFDIRKHAKEVLKGEEEEETLPMSNEETNLFEAQVNEMLDKGLDHIENLYEDEEEEENK